MTLGKPEILTDIDNLQSTVATHSSQLEDMSNVKADKTYVNAQVQNMSAQVQGFYATSSALTSAFPTGNSNNYVVTGDNNYVYRWNGSAWTSTGFVWSNALLADNTVNPKKTTFFNEIVGVNLYNPTDADVTDGNLINITTGGLTANASYIASGWIAVKAGKVRISANYEIATVFRYALYNSSKTFLSGVSVSSSTHEGSRYYIEIDVASDGYIRFSMFKTWYTSLSVYQPMVANSTEILYQAYVETKYTIKDENLPSYTQKDYSTLEKVNLLNVANIVVGKMQSETALTPSNNASYSITGEITVEPNTTVYFSNDGVPIPCRFVCALTASGSLVSQVADSNNGKYSFNVPSNCAKIVVTFLNTLFNTSSPKLQVQKYFVSKYVAYSSELNKKVTRNYLYTNDLDVFLPPEICVSVGRTIEIYNRQVCLQAEKCHFQWTCNVGRAMKRKFSITGATGIIGNYTLTLAIYDDNLNCLYRGSTTLKIVKATLADEVDLTSIGDSLTNGKEWLTELKTLSSNKIKFVGTRTLGVPTGEGHEGRSGVTSGWYLANSTYTFDSNFDGSGSDGTKNPFWNPSTSQFDFNYYKTTYGKNPNAVQIFLGTNGIALDSTVNANNIKGIVDGIRASDSTIPIFVVNTLYRGDQNGIGNQLSTDGYSAGSGVWKYQEDKKVFNLIVRLYELLKDYTNLHFVPVSLTFDSEYNFKNPSITTPVNPRSSITEVQDTEATHPQTYLQMSDVIYSTMCAYLP